MIENWPESSYSNYRHSPGYSYNQPTIGICFDTGKISAAKTGLKCWEIFWGAVEPRLIAGSLLFEGKLVESENVYCLGIQNSEAWRLEHVLEILGANAGFLDVGASPHFYQGDSIFRELIIGVGQVDMAGKIVGISYNARLALNKIKREKMAVVRADEIYCGAEPEIAKVINACELSSPWVKAPVPLRKWWRT